MRPRFRARPERSELLGLELLEIVRDFPETLSVFRSHGADLREGGTRRLEEVVRPGGPDGSPPESLVDDLLSVLSWRDA